MKKGISQEGLKLIACVTMFIDHLGYEILYPLFYDSQNWLYVLSRTVGRLAWPIYAFLLVEGVSRTRDKKKYVLRLAVGALLAEIPYDLMASGTPFAPKFSIMVTLLLGCLMVMAMDALPRQVWKPIIVAPFVLLTMYVPVDYGWKGIALIAIFALSREMEPKNLIRFCAMVILFHYQQGNPVWFGNFAVPRQAFGALSMLFIAAYDGRKLTRSRAVQWGFYLFYPVHMLLLWWLGMLL